MRRMKFEGGTAVYEIDGESVTKKQFDQGWITPPPDYKKNESASVRSDLNDFSGENGGKGRYNPQLAKHPNDPNAYFRSVNNVREAARERGFTTEE